MRFRARIHIVLILAAGVLLSGCSSLLFYPERQLLGTPDQVGIDYQEERFTSSDGVALHGWMLPARNREAKGTILFLHGNAQNISFHLSAIHWLPDYGFNVFLFDYRGFGLSEGRATLKGVHRDAAAALAFVRTLPEVDPDRLVVLGQSIGAAIAVPTVAADKGPLRAVILDSPLYGYRKITREKLGHFFLTWPLQWPLSFLMPDGFSPYRYIGQVSPTPLLIIHGDADRTVPFHHGEMLYRKARPPKQFWRVPGGRHIESMSPARHDIRMRLVDYLNKTFSGEPADPAPGQSAGQSAAQ